MSLVIACPCGQPLQTQPQHRGKRIRCPMCKGILQVPPLEPKPLPPPVPKSAREVEEELLLQPIPKEEEFSEPILEDEDEGYQLAATARCPKCKREWPVKTVLCIECGYNLKTGQQLTTVYEVRDRNVVQGEPSLGTYRLFTIKRSASGRILFSMQSWLLGMLTPRRSPCC